MKRKSCGITGHRPQKFPWKRNEADPRCVALKENLAKQIERLVDDGFTDFLTGMAEGVDTWAALIVLDLREKNPKLKLHCILPCRKQTEGWSDAARTQYYEVLDQADSIVYVNREFRKNCMLERNRFLADHSDLLLAVYNGERRGGTAATIRYAQKNCIPNLILNCQDIDSLSQI